MWDVTWWREGSPGVGVEARYLIDLKHQRFLEESEGGEFQDVLNSLAKKKKWEGS